MAIGTLLSWVSRTDNHTQTLEDLIGGGRAGWDGEKATGAPSGAATRNHRTLKMQWNLSTKAARLYYTSNPTVPCTDACSWPEPGFENSCGAKNSEVVHLISFLFAVSGG
jgi:hypothetical protein